MDDDDESEDRIDEHALHNASVTYISNMACSFVIYLKSLLCRNTAVWAENRARADERGCG